MNPYEYALIAQEAYTATPDIGIAGSASRAIIRHTAAGLCIAFPGSDNPECWEADFDVIPLDVPGVGEMHKGFWRAWQAIEDPVLAAIGNQLVTLVGHSLGGAIAICAAVSLALNGKPPAAVYGFEPPRVSPGDGVAKLLAGVPLHLYKNGGDIVPDLPFGWHHGAPLTHIGPPALLNVDDHALGRVLDALKS